MLTETVDRPRANASVVDPDERGREGLYAKDQLKTSPPGDGVREADIQRSLSPAHEDVEIARVDDALAQSFMIFGAPRMGKTNLLLNIHPTGGVAVA